jgi:glycosyltransferase involved in cell wall biosynthesis
MKVALIGNMNNNNFALMRYLRDLGVDAHLLLLQNDGIGSRSHFCPENDTWEIDKWAQYIHRLLVWDSATQVLNRHFFYYVLFRPVFLIKKMLKQANAACYAPLSLRSTRIAFDGFDKYIGSGLAPAIFYQIKLQLDIFYPYAIGIEWVGDAFFVNTLQQGNLYQRKSLGKVCKLQKRGVTEAQHCVNTELSATQHEFNKLGVRFKKIAIPMVYNREFIDESLLPAHLMQLKKELDEIEFKIINHTRLEWVNPGSFDDLVWEKNSKNNDWLIKSYAKFLALRPELNCKLIILEYGRDVDATKALIQELGIQDKVKWLPLMSRREIMQLLSWCDVAVGEFYSECILWGGVGWEVLSVGRALIQGFNFSEESFFSMYGYLPPPLLTVRSSGDILHHLLEMADYPDKCIKIGKDAKIWFDRYNGIDLAKQWMNLLHSSG